MGSLFFGGGSGTSSEPPIYAPRCWGRFSLHQYSTLNVELSSGRLFCLSQILIRSRTFYAVFRMRPCPPQVSLQPSRGLVSRRWSPCAPCPSAPLLPTQQVHIQAQPLGDLLSIRCDPRLICSLFQNPERPKHSLSV